MSVDAFTLEGDAALGDRPPVEAQQPRDRSQEGGLAGAVGAEERHDRARLDLQAHPAQDVDG